MWIIGNNCSNLWKIGIKSSHMKNWYQIIIYDKLVSKLARLKNCSNSSHIMKKWYQIITDIKNWCLHVIITDISGKTVKKGGGKALSNLNVRNTLVCYMKFYFVRIFHKVWDTDTKYVAYWYILTFSRDSDVVFCLQSCQGLTLDRSLAY